MHEQSRSREKKKKRIVKGGQTQEALLDADWLADEDHGHPTVNPLPLDEQELTHERADVHDLADLARLGLAIHLEDAGPQGIIAARIMNGVEDPRVLEGFRLARVDLRTLRQSLQHYLARLISIVDDHNLDIVLTHPLGGSLDGLFGHGTRVVFLCLGHSWISFFY